MIQPLEPNLIKPVVELWLQTSLTAHDFIPAAYWQKNVSMIQDTFLPMSETYVWLEGQEVQGFVSILGKGAIGALFVAHQYQNRGIGRELLNFCKTRYPTLSLWVYTENHKAVSFYKQQGFHPGTVQVDEATGHMECEMIWEADVTI